MGSVSCPSLGGEDVSGVLGSVANDIINPTVISLERYHDSKSHFALLNDVEVVLMDVEKSSSSVKVLFGLFKETRFVKFVNLLGSIFLGVDLSLSTAKGSERRGGKELFLGELCELRKHDIYLS
jgi:hypothetical protein